MLTHLNEFNLPDHTIRFDGMVSATALAETYFNTTGIQKDVRDWLKTEEVKESIACLERFTGIPVTSLVIVDHNKETWFHPSIAEIFAAWISPEYGIGIKALFFRAKGKGKKELVAQPIQPEVFEPHNRIM